MDESRLPLGRVCTKCGEWKPFEDFYLSKGGRHGRTSWCKSCYSVRHKAYREGPGRERILKQKRESERVWRENNPELNRERQKAQREKRREKQAAYHRRYYEANAQKYRDRARQWRIDNPEKAKASDREYRKNNPEKLSFHSSQYQDRKRANGGDGFTLEQWLELCEAFGNVCLCCGSSGPLTVDHVVPISLGGPHELENVQPLCKSCNCKKHARIIDYRAKRS